MPIYEYQCTECEQEIEVIQKMTDDPLTTCETCQGLLRKKVSLSGFALKGGGWYKDGYSSQPAKSTESAAKTPKSEPVKKNNSTKKESA